MPPMTPSRLVIVVLSFSLISFLWTFGLPRQLAQPSLPIIDHKDHTIAHPDPFLPAEVIEKSYATTPSPTPHGDDHRWDDTTRKVGKVQAQTASLGPAETSIAEFEKDGGRWEDKKQLKEAATSHAPTTLLTAAIPAPTANASNPTAGPSSHNVSEYCKHVPGASDVMVVLRTSKAEMDKKLPSHLHALLSCVPKFAIFSDHSGEIGGYKVHNALDTISSEAKRTHDVFREYQIMHADAEHKPDAKKTKELDKWKFLPMVYKSYHLNPSAKFIIFIEADTSLSWTNLLQWVGRLDYRIPYNSGAPTFMNGFQLAQRGSGILLSQGALRRYAKSYDELYTTKWEERVGKECCGDLVLSMALNDAHVELYPSWPLLQGEQPNTLDYTKRHWCVPAVSWHHTNGEDLSGMWELEKNWTQTHGWNKPYLFRDAFHEYVEPHMEARKESWDNLSQDTKIVAPQGRQQQMKEEEERSKKHKEEAGEKKENQQKEDEKTAQQKKQGSLELQRGDSKSSFEKSKREDKKEELDWGKLAEKFKDAGDSSGKCMKACEQTEDCMQWRYTTKGDGECHLGKVLRLGKKTEGNDKWTSGWLVDRVKNVTREWECKEVNWRFYQ